MRRSIRGAEAWGIARQSLGCGATAIPNGHQGLDDDDAQAVKRRDERILLARHATECQDDDPHRKRAVLDAGSKADPARSVAPTPQRAGQPIPHSAHRQTETDCGHIDGKPGP
ncbi:MAG: hypothetical protein P3W94_003460 [Paracoccus sp. (in: a-proteobacteria)]|nr:hypothetical protein [Paracoccus sp. (in: a-proteobacteria)]